MSTVTSSAPSRTVVRATIVGGGDRNQLLQQLTFIGRRGIDGGHLDTALFPVKLERNGEFREEFIRIYGLQAEDGSGHSWIITGSYIDPATGRSGTFKGYYNTRTRSGFIDITLNVR